MQSIFLFLVIFIVGTWAQGYIRLHCTDENYPHIEEIKVQRRDGGEVKMFAVCINDKDGKKLSTPIFLGEKESVDA